MTPEIKQRIEQIRRGEVPKGYKKTKAGIVPSVWDVTKLSSISSHVTKKNADGKVRTTFTNSATQGVIKQTDYFDKEISNKENITGYYVVQEDDYIYNPRISASAPCGPINKSHFEEQGVVSPLYTVFKMNDDMQKNRYIEFYLKSSFWYRYMCEVANYGARHDRMNITNDDLFGMPIPLPPFAEQEKIAEILSAQDKIIELYKRKIEKLEKLKKAFMQKMFPQKGESIPKWRFPQFTAPWEERKFGTMFKRRTERNNGQFDNTRWISVAKMYFQESEKVSSNNIDTRTYVMRRGDIAFEGHSNAEYKYGRFVANDIGDGVISELFPIYMHIDDYDESYWKYAIQIENIMAPKLLRCIEISYTSSNKLDEDFFLKETVLVPSISEQQQIGSYFRRMDDLIKIHKQKLDQEKQKKKALMQLLLTGIVRVNI